MRGRKWKQQRWVRILVNVKSGHKKTLTNFVLLSTGQTVIMKVYWLISDFLVFPQRSNTLSSGKATMELSVEQYGEVSVYYEIVTEGSSCRDITC